LNAGEAGRHAANYILDNNVHISFRNQLWGGGGWGLDGNITLDDSLENKTDDPFLVGLVAHEAYHLEQGPAWALSKIGEIEAWKLGFAVQRDFSHQELIGISKKIADLDLDNAYDDPQPAIDLIHKYNEVADDPVYNFMFNLLPKYPVSWYFIYVSMDFIRK
jgi:hypothetical protein